MNCVVLVEKYCIICRSEWMFVNSRWSRLLTVGKYLPRYLAASEVRPELVRLSFVRHNNI